MRLERNRHRTVPVVALIHLGYCFVQGSQAVSLGLSVTIIALIGLFNSLFIHEKSR